MTLANFSFSARSAISAFVGRLDPRVASRIAARLIARSCLRLAKLMTETTFFRRSWIVRGERRGLLGCLSFGALAFMFEYGAVKCLLRFLGERHSSNHFGGIELGIGGEADSFLLAVTG